MGLIKYATGVVIVLLTLLSCNSDTSLQRYLVDKQGDDRFLKVDLATSLLQSDNASFTAEQKDILNTVKKMNVVAYPVKNSNLTEFESEKAKVKAILSQDKYQKLMTIKSGDMDMNLSYLGEEDAIDEVIIFATTNEKGFGVFRLLCDNMKPDQMLKLATTLESGDIDLSKLAGMGDMFQEM